MDCLFCTPEKNLKKYIILENKFFYASFDSFPVTPGHMEIIPKKHIVSLLDLNAEEWKVLQEALNEGVKIIENIDLKRVYEEILQSPLNEKSKEFCEKMLNHVGINKKPDAYNFGNNDGEAAGRTVHHLHIHIIPRYFGDVEDPRGGIRHIIPGMGNYRK